MSSSGPLSAVTLADDATVGAIAWTNPSSASANDASYATSILLITQLTHYLKATNFGFAIPGDATITGILVEIENLSTVNLGTADNSVKIVKADGTFGSQEKASATKWPTSEAYMSYGGSTDLWTETWTPANINNVNFGVGVSANAVLASTAEIDHIRITVSWTGSNRIGPKRFTCASGMSVSEGY